MKVYGKLVFVHMDKKQSTGKLHAQYTWAYGNKQNQ